MTDVLPSRHAGTPEPELRLVLLGTIGCGKTLSGDTLLGQPSSGSSSASGSSHKLCQLRRGASEGRRMTVVEAPRWYWSGGHMEAGVRKETERALELAAPGPHAFLLLVPVGQFTEVERRVPAELEDVFGQGVLKHTLVLFTCGDYLMGRGAGQYLEGEDPGLREVIDRCGSQYHVINNRRPQDREQVRELLEKVENMVQKNRGCYIRQNTLQREVEEQARERERELEEKVEEQARERERELKEKVEEQARERERVLKKVEEQARERERELKEKVEEQVRERERELKEKVEEQARERERELKEKVEEQARERERVLKEKVEEQAREREKELKEKVEEQARERERELKERYKVKEERETVLESRHVTNTETRRYCGSQKREVTPNSAIERRREEEREEIKRREESAEMENRKEEMEKIRKERDEIMKRRKEREEMERNIEEEWEKRRKDEMKKRRERERVLKEKVEEQARERERELKKKVEEQARERERVLKEKVEEQARERERELKVEEQARERERELKKKVEEQARESERELKKKVEEQARERERVLKEKVVEQARERERELKEVEEQARERERELESRHVTNTETRRYWGNRKREITPNSAKERREEEREEIKRRSEEIERKREEIERRRMEEMEDLEENVTVKPLVNCLHSTPTPQPQQQPTEPQNGGPALFTRIPSFHLSEEDDILSQLSEVKAKPTQKVVNTFCHRINSFGEKTTSPPSSSSKSSSLVSRNPEASPSTSPPSSSPLTSTLPISPSTSSLVSRSPVSSSSSPLSSSPLPSSSYTSSSSQSELRVVLLGRSGSGKSAAGNIILGREEFVSRPDITTAVTQDCQKSRALVAGRRVAVVDTPDWFRSEYPPDVVRSQLSSCVALSAPGPHAFILCVPVDQPAQAELQALGALEKVFGPGAVRTHTLVLFTHSDRLKESGKVGVEEVEKYISSQRRDLLELVKLCGDRYHVMERGSGGEEEERKRRSVGELLEKVEQTVREGGGECFSCPLFQEAEDRVRQRQKEIVRERRGRGEEVKRQALHSYSMQPLRETEEEVDEEEIERTREEAEKSVSALELENLPSLSSSSTWSSSFLRSVWEKVGAGASKVPKLTAGGALLGGVVGVFFGGPIGGAIGATAGSVVTEVGRRRFSKTKNSAEETDATGRTEGEILDKLLKTE